MTESYPGVLLESELRDMAETRLRTGTAGMAGNYSLGLDALNLLHRLSSNPESASDAIKLLHELQVHQVEIDLQNEAIQNERHHLCDELASYRELYERAPAGYFVVDFNTRILKVNQAGAELFNMARDTLTGTSMQRYLAPDSRLALAAMVKRLLQGESGLIAEVSTSSLATPPRYLRIMGNLSPARAGALLVCCEIS